jgi:hypothetical protein
MSLDLDDDDATLQTRFSIAKVVAEESDESSESN